MGGAFHAGTFLRVAFHAFVVAVDIVSACRSLAWLSWVRDIWPDLALWVLALREGVACSSHRPRLLIQSQNLSPNLILNLSPNWNRNHLNQIPNCPLVAVAAAGTVDLILVQHFALEGLQAVVVAL